MKKVVFFLKLSVFVSTIACFVWFGIMPQFDLQYNASLIDKWNRLKSIKEPKIILVGDSNVAFGIDSQKIQEAFNMPVVNFGLHGGLGQAFHTDMIKPYINEGDIVVIFPAEYNNADTKILDCVLLWTAIGNNIDIWQGISFENYTKIILAYPTYLKRAIVLWISNKGNTTDGVYSRAAFNEYGDNVYPRPNCIISEGNYDSYFASRNLSEVMRVYWNKYNEYILNKNARLFMSSPPILDETLPNDLDLDALQKQLEDELNFPMISRLHNYIYPLEYFYDTGFHLTDVGKTIRTEQLILDISAALLAPTFSNY